MTLYVYNQAFELIGVLDAYESLIWTTRYYSEGDFELYIPAKHEYLEILLQNNYIVRETQLDNAMIIERIRIETNLETGNYLLVSGRCLKSLLNRRIIWEQTTLSGRVEVCIRKLVTENAISPTITARKIPSLVLGALNGFTETMSNQYTGDELLYTITTICKNVGYGFDIKFDADNKTFTFEIYKGTNRSFSQTVNPYVVFSPDYDNLISSDYVTSQMDLKNVARIGGEGEGSARRYATSGNASGLTRRELFVDARDISSDDGTIKNTEYNSLLVDRGNEKLAAYIATQAFSGETDTEHAYKLNRDFFLGDIVQVQNEYGISAAPRIVEIIENTDENGVKTIPTFSDF